MRGANCAQKSLCEKRLEGAMREALTDAEKAEHKTLKEKVGSAQRNDAWRRWQTPTKDGCGKDDCASLQAAAAAAEQAELNAKVVAQEEKTQHLLRELQEAGGPEMKQRRQKLLLAERSEQAAHGLPSQTHATAHCLLRLEHGVSLRSSRNSTALRVRFQI